MCEEPSRVLELPGTVSVLPTLKHQDTRLRTQVLQGFPEEEGPRETGSDHNDVKRFAR